MSEETMRAYYAAYNAEDPAHLGALLDDHVVLTSAAGEQRGRDAYLATYAYMIGLFVDRMEPVEIAADADGATVRITDRLTAREDIPDFMGQRLAKGQTITLDLVGRYRIRDGRIAAIRIEPAG
ncbi:nuclear transport factor 2 family protein [Sphingomonas jatrophae]|uniref:SnoaL-like domain-containing protein n=1 Tax=Sphingomonas jatrophae TaxID=1166337 RepID=A0A1I6KGF7_9SPHN|nr:nuclear transport factor 2 family protein [Sphingomonas jatrophae]SFR90276.1 SnoaL-like domain-containing protein [Sphingomonas jatrophae]